MGPREIIRSKDINANPIKKSGNAGPRPWELQKYIYQEKPTEEKGSLHSDPRLELARRQDQESHFIPSDEDDGYGPSVLGNGFMPGLDAHASFASDLGTLAGWTFKKGEGFKWENTKEDRETRQGVERMKQTIRELTKQHIAARQRK
jgi:hypothetical protein